MRILYFLFFIITVTGWSQTGKITGRVIFGNNETALGASVNISGTKKFAIVDHDGQFEIKGLTYGNYTLEISSLEAKNKTVNVILNRASVEITISLEKTSDPKILKEVVIQKTTAKKEIIEKGFSVNVIETQEAAKRNIQTNDLLGQSVGVRIRQNGGLGSSVNYNLNGMSGNAIRIFIDGIPISTYGSSFNLNSIPPALIERIEVYKGVIPAHLADDALGGAINVILKKGAKNSLNASVSYGSFNTIQSNFNTTYRDKSGFTLKGSGFYNYSDNNYEIWGKFARDVQADGVMNQIRAKRFNDAYRSYGGRFELGFTDVEWADTFLVGINMSDDYNEIQHGQAMSTPYKGRFTEADAKVISINYAKKDFIIKGLEFNINSVFSQRNEVLNDTVKWNYNWFNEKLIGLKGLPVLTPNGAQQGSPTILHINNKIFSTRGGLNYSINENHRFVFSTMLYSFMRDDYDEMKSELERNFQQKRDLQKNILSFAYEFEGLGSRLRTNVFGKRYQQKTEQRTPILTTTNGQTTITENLENNNTIFYGYGFAASYFILPKLMLSTSAEKAIRLPSENEIFGNPGENQISNSSLKPEQSNNLNVGFRFGPFKVNEHKFSAGGSGFWRNSKDKIVRQFSTRVNEALQATPSVNMGTAQSLGYEASLEYSNKNKLFISMNMSRFNSLFKLKYDPSGKIYDHYNKQYPNEPYFIINANAQYNFKNVLQEKSELNLYYNFSYVGEFYTTWLQTEMDKTPSQFPHDLGLSYIFPSKRYIVSFDAKNITNEEVYDNFAVQKPGRAFYLKVNYILNKF
ncbi:outer membrane receptor protein involved in Fe transport [Flavobacterium sp. HSC-32F16]|uniref:TonB-dependent receptor n=1 Tax=Flavobacterium sp. HSC-32F16 TaxID=2910964 RepID=UPI0020A39C0B|nr:TonB-dependent receptor plug domain-containing protein [Flavobacterium sp. HSC-32F16]MCP2028395.1 outer membrane receptor protein involved in Fe transport [Flavobacterium sp. HSC-32F16]